MTTGLLSLKWNNHRSTFFHVLATIRQKESYCDVTLACDGKFYSLHKFVLSTCSEYFEEMFERTQCKHPVIVLKDIKSEEFEALLNYMYVGEVNVVQEKLGGLIKAAECLKIKGLAVPDENPFESESGRQKRPQRSDDSPKSKRKRRENSSDAGEENITNNNSNSRSRQKSRDNSFNSSYQPKTSSNNVNNDSNSRELTSSQERSRKQSHKTEAQPEPITLDEDIKAEPAESEECYDGIVDSGNNDSQPLDIREGDEEEEDSKDALHQELGFDPSDGGGGGGGADYEELDPSLLGEQHMQSMDDMNQSGDYQQNSFSMWEGGDNSGSYSNEGYAGDAGGSRQMVSRSNSPPQHLNQLITTHHGMRPPSSSSSASSSLPYLLPSASSSRTHRTSVPGHHHQLSTVRHNKRSSWGERRIDRCKEDQPVDSTTTTARITPPSPQLPGWTCGVCGIHFTQRGHLNRHMLTHTGEKPHRCPLCDHCSARADNLRHHVASRHGQEALALLQHSQLVDGAQDRMCSTSADELHSMIVGAADPSSSSSLHHYTSSSSAPGITTSTEGSSSLKDTLEPLISTNHSVKPPQHSCRLCSYSSIKRFNVQTHVMKHMNIKPFQCQYCPYRSTFKKDVIKHALLKHAR